MATKNRSFHVSGLGVSSDYEALIVVKEPLFNSDRINARLVLPNGPLRLDQFDLRSLADLFNEAADEITAMYDKRKAE